MEEINNLGPSHTKMRYEMINKKRISIGSIDLPEDDEHLDLGLVFRSVVIICPT